MSSAVLDRANRAPPQRSWRPLDGPVGRMSLEEGRRPNHPTKPLNFEDLSNSGFRVDGTGTGLLFWYKQSAGRRLRVS